MFITAKTLGDGQKTVILNADYIKSIETGGIVHMVDTVKKYKVGADAIQRLLVDMILAEKRLGIGTQHYTREIAREIAEEVDDGQNDSENRSHVPNIRESR
jgi:hypothetical protein